MNDIAVIAFKAIDYFFWYPQNCLKFKNITIEKDIVYSDVAECCKLNFHYDLSKKPEGKWPVLVQVHGGGFVAGDKKFRKSLCNFYADKGFFVLNVNYGLGPKYPFHDYVKHLGLAMNWLADNAEKYNLDLENVNVTGDSAGGHATAVIGCLYANPEYREKFGVEDFSDKMTITHLLPACGVFDAPKALAKKFPFNAGKILCQDLAGIKLSKDMHELPTYEYYNECSPVNFVTANWPKTHITQVVNDLFCNGQGDALYEKLTELNVPVEKFERGRFGDLHCFHLMWRRKSSKEWRKEMTDYIEKEGIIR